MRATASGITRFINPLKHIFS